MSNFTDISAFVKASKVDAMNQHKRAYFSFSYGALDEEVMRGNNCAAIGGFLLLEAAMIGLGKI